MHADVSACLHARQLCQGQDRARPGGDVNTVGMRCEGINAGMKRTHCEREVLRSDCSAHLQWTVLYLSIPLSGADVKKVTIYLFTARPWL